MDTLRRALETIIGETDRSHVERLTLVAAIISEALGQRGLEATLVGGGAVEFYDPGAHTTSDIDLVVERKRQIRDLESELIDVFTKLGFERHGRHWKRSDLFVEIPARAMTDPTEVFQVGPYALRVVRKEIVLAERIVGFKHWRYTGHGAQAIDMIAAFGDEIDQPLLQRYLQREDAEDAFEVLRKLAHSNVIVDDEVLRKELMNLGQGRQKEAAGSGD